MWFDPIYWAFLVPSMAIALYAQFRVMSTFKKYAQVPVDSGMTGAEVAGKILQEAGIPDVSIERTQSFLGDHYDPRHKKLVLSPNVYDGNSISAVGVAAHECGHAIQHQVGYAPLHLRMMVVPLTMVTSNMLLPLVFLAFFFRAIPFEWVIPIAIVTYSVLVVFQLITLPVEFDASARAKVILSEMGVVNAQEAVGVNKVLNAAGFTYVAALITSLIELAYWILRAQQRR